MTAHKLHIPRVSVLMPAYNSARYIAEAIASVQAQTMADWELIIVDDCSQDATCDIVRELAASDPRIRLHRNTENMGAALSRNRGLSLCGGEFVALLDSDDRWYPEKLEKQLDLAKTTGADIVYCSYALVDGQGEKKCADFIVPDRTDLEAMLSVSVISCSTALLSRAVVEEFRFPTEYYHEDLAFWLLLLRSGKQAAGVTEVLADYRVLQNSRASNKLASACHRWTIYRKLLGMSLRESMRCLAQYTFAGVRKYRTHRAG